MFDIQIQWVLGIKSDQYLVRRRVKKLNNKALILCKSFQLFLKILEKLEKVWITKEAKQFYGIDLQIHF